MQICQALGVEREPLDDSVLQDTELHAPGFFVSALIMLCVHIKHTLVCSIGDPKLSSIKESPENDSVGSRGEDGMSDKVV